MCAVVTEIRVVEASNPMRALRIRDFEGIVVELEYPDLRDIKCSASEVDFSRVMIGMIQDRAEVVVLAL